MFSENFSQTGRPLSDLADCLTFEQHCILEFWPQFVDKQKANRTVQQQQHEQRDKNRKKRKLSRAESHSRPLFVIFFSSGGRSTDILRLPSCIFEFIWFFCSLSAQQKALKNTSPRKRLSLRITKPRQHCKKEKKTKVKFTSRFPPSKSLLSWNF